ELRSRVSRMEELPELEALRAVCQPLAQRGLVVYLSPEGRRGTTLTHGFHDPQELERMKSRSIDHADPGPPRHAESPSPTAPRLDRLEHEVAHLRDALTVLQRELIEIRALVGTEKTPPGEPSP
ncbi:MAG TPA: hypothetical protein VH120_18315, partial [Gemmataceae bacterium]|nr:hypothetical protein [Gemmataceae bacterium]